MTKVYQSNFGKPSRVHVEGMSVDWVQTLMHLSEILDFEICSGNDWL